MDECRELSQFTWQPDEYRLKSCRYACNKPRGQTQLATTDVIMYAMCGVPIKNYDHANMHLEGQNFTDFWLAKHFIGKIFASQTIPKKIFFMGKISSSYYGVVFRNSPTTVDPP